MDNENNKGNLLCNEFSLYPKNVTAEVVLTQENITITNNSNRKQETISLNDVIGCHILEGNKTTVADYYLCIFHYPFRKRLFKGLSRVRCSKSLGITLEDTDEMQKALADKWKRVIKNIIVGNVVQKEQIDDLTHVKPRRLIVYVNPFSGQGKAMTIYKEQVRSFFAEAEIKHQMIKTEYAGHAQEMAKVLEVEKYDGIVIVSGDGLVHEVINGLMERQDWQTAIKTPLGIVPGGSGNALAAAVVYASTKQKASNDLNTDCLFEMVCGRYREMSLVQVQLNTRSFYSFLNVGWGYVADVDIESEKYRAVGSARFTIGSVVRIANLRIYPGMISYLPTNESDNHFSLNIPKNAVKIASPHKDRNESAIESEASSILKTGDKKTWHQTLDQRETSRDLRSNSNPPQMTGFTRALSQESHSDELTAKSLSASTIDIDAGGLSDNDSVAPIIDLNATSNKDNGFLTKKLCDQIPENWLSFESDFVWIMPVHLSHVGKDMFIMPPSKIGDDVIYLYCLKAGLSKVQLARILLSINEGTHFQFGGEHSIVIPCKAYRLEPFVKNSGMLTSDGELIPYGPLQATTTDIKANIFCSVSSEHT